MTNKKRISLLSDSEIDDIYAFPEFNDHERELYFSFNSEHWSAINANDIVTSQIHTMLKIVYFRAKQFLYTFDYDLMLEDMKYLAEKYFDKNQLLPKSIDRRTERNLNELIIKVFGYQRYDKNDQRINKHLAMLIKHYPKPHNAARELIKYFEKIKVILPSYRTMQDLYSEANAQEMAKLHHLIEGIPQNIKDELTSLVHNDNTDDDKVITLQSIRYDQQDFSYTEVRGGVNKINALSRLYQFSKPFLLKTQFAQNAIRYYSELVEQYPVARLRKLSLDSQYLYFICFIYHRYQVLADQAIISFIHHILLLKADIKEHVDTQMSHHIVSIVKKYPSLVSFFRWFPESRK